MTNELSELFFREELPVAQRLELLAYIFALETGLAAAQGDRELLTESRKTAQLYHSIKHGNAHKTHRTRT
jgi:hypothetical protein